MNSSAKNSSPALQLSNLTLSRIHSSRFLIVKSTICVYKIYQREVGNNYKIPKEMLFDCCNEIQKYKCPTCVNFGTNFLATLKHHFRENHDENSTKTLYECSKCSFMTSSKYDLEPHNFFCECQKRNVHDWGKQSRLHVKSADIQWFTCHHCPYRCKQKGYLKTHIAVRHTKPEDIQWLKCPHCSYKFKQKTSLKRHVRYLHSKSEDILWFTCNQCSAKFKRNYNLERHTVAFHTNPGDIQWFKCDQCPLKFKEKGSLNRHVRSLHSKPEDIQWFACGQCSAKFKRKYDVERHNASFHANPEDVQWFECDQCPSKFKQKQSLKRHVRNLHCKPKDI